MEPLGSGSVAALAPNRRISALQHAPNAHSNGLGSSAVDVAVITACKVCRTAAAAHLSRHNFGNGDSDSIAQLEISFAAVYYVCGTNDSLEAHSLSPICYVMM